MRFPWSLLKMICCTCLFAQVLSSQEAPRKALVMGLHGPGLYVPISSSAALRADATVSVSATQGVDFWNASVGLSGLFYQGTSDALRTYVGPRVGYAYSAPSSGIAHTGTISGSLLFGAEYSLSRRFGAFGESGVTYSRTTGTRLNSQTNTAIDVAPTNAAAIFSGVGLLLHF